MSSESSNLPPVLTPVYDEAVVREAQRQQEFIQRLRSSRPVATIAIIAVCAAVFGLEALWANMGEGQEGSYGVLKMGGMMGVAVQHGEWWRLWAATFLHFGVLHIVMNMMAFWSLGQLMEPAYGARRLLIVYAISGLVGNLPYLFQDTEILGAGASGAIWGVMTGMYALTLRPQGFIPLGIARRLRSRLVSPLIINLAISFLPGIGLFAHLGGGIVGFVLVYSGLLGRQTEEEAAFPGSRSHGGHWTTWAAAALVAGMLVSMGWALWAGQPWTAG